jgi:peptidoglycan/LPS O-acetylase OafA/YrhL
VDTVADMIDTKQAGPRHNWQTITLLTLLTLANGFVFVALIFAWVDDVDHGGDWGDKELNYIVFATVLQAAAVGALLAAWFKRLWGAQTYLAIQVLALFILLVTTPEAFSLQNLLSIALAGLLVSVCGKAWRDSAASL